VTAAAATVTTGAGIGTLDASIELIVALSFVSFSIGPQFSIFFCKKTTNYFLSIQIPLWNSGDIEIE
jgi:hypothetical protein